jgi:hypothetical protein
MNKSISNIKVFKETNVDLNYKHYVVCNGCNEKLTASWLTEDGSLEVNPIMVGTRKYCDQCKHEKQLQLNKIKQLSKIRKNPNCKECGLPNSKGKQYCSDACFHKGVLRNKKKNNHLTRILINGLTKKDEIKYYNDIITKVSSYIELRKVDTMKHKRSYGWVVKYCKPKWMLSASERLNVIKKEKEERDIQNLLEVEKLPYIKRVIKTYYNTENTFRIECECTNGHILKRDVSKILKQKECTLCRTEDIRNEKRIQKELQLEIRLKEKTETKLIKELERVNRVSEFINSDEYKKYNNWKQTPISFEYTWLRTEGKVYLNEELKLKLDKISYFIYKTAGARCPYPKKKGHRWCRHCELEKTNDNFRGKNICVDCSKIYRKENYYEADKTKLKINYHTDPMVKLHTLIRVYVLSALKGKPKSYRTKDILGIEWNEFRDYIEGMFEPWMNWDNHGHGKGKWALQHIIPKTYAETEDDIYRLNYYKNLMPMNFLDNGALRDRILRYQLNEWHYDNCSDLLDKYKNKIIESMDDVNGYNISNDQNTIYNPFW